MNGYFSVGLTKIAVKQKRLEMNRIDGGGYENIIVVKSKIFKYHLTSQILELMCTLVKVEKRKQKSPDEVLLFK